MATSGTLWQRGNAAAYRYADLAAILFVTAGLAHRLLVASKTFLTPEEAFQVMLAVGAHPAGPLEHPFIYTHPPLSLFLYRLMELVYNSGFAMRIPFALAGAAMPLLVYAWLKRLRGVVAAWIALFILLMGPNLFFLGWQARGYIVALLGMAVALYALERALAGNSARWMALSFLGLYAALLSEYMSVWFWMTASVYAPLRLWAFAGRLPGPRSPAETRAKESHLTEFAIAWLAGQAGAGAILVWLQLLRSAKMRLGGLAKIGVAQPYLADQYLSPGENPLAFLARNTVEAFGYVFVSDWAGAAAFGAFLTGVLLLWTGRATGGDRNRALVVLLVLPFVFAAPAALIRIHPYGGTRHSVHLAIFIAAGAAIGLEPLFRRRIAILAIVMTFAAPIWYFRGPNDLAAAPQGHLLLQPLLEAIDYLRRNAPPGAVVLTDQESRLVLSYYLDSETPWPRGIRGNEETVEGYTFFALRWSYTGFEEIREDLAVLRERYGIPPGESVWGVDTGFICGAMLHLRREPALRQELRSAREFGLGAAVFEMPPGFESQAPAAD